MREHAVVVAGGGPTGLMLAGELTLAASTSSSSSSGGERRSSSGRARGVHSRTIEVLDQRGIADRFLAEGQALQSGAFAGVRLDIGYFPTRHNYGLALAQSHFERVLAGWVGELGMAIVREREVTGFAQDEAGIDVEVSDGSRLRARYLVAPWAERVRLVETEHDGAWELPVLGAVDAPGAVLVRPGRPCRVGRRRRHGRTPGFAQQMVRESRLRG